MYCISIFCSVEHNINTFSCHCPPWFGKQPPVIRHQPHIYLPSMMKLTLLVGMVTFLSITPSHAFICDNAFDLHGPTTRGGEERATCTTGSVNRACTLDRCIVRGPPGTRSRYLPYLVFIRCVDKANPSQSISVAPVNYHIHNDEQLDVWGYEVYRDTNIKASKLGAYLCPRKNPWRPECDDDACVPA
ncbi:hypothetical protein PGTUg99_034069 [Puccinia graminis f. sp. tritici]|uniref:Uncharacterized protein n=1 Tax=Puccinia graminis f. sp. tritici TaxID=56615 RepID=A0A5B0RNV2_PUCGR|nr:hypothetical protein PGTUg99_034069 [Puccinia graminis f. sp. tritici]